MNSKNAETRQTAIYPMNDQLDQTDRPNGLSHDYRPAIYPYLRTDRPIALP